MKNLANCNLHEFATQTVRIKRLAKKWLTETDLIGIMSRISETETVNDGMTEEEKKVVRLKNLQARRKKRMENFSEAFDALMEAHPDDTLELVALCCFVEPEDMDEHPVSEYLACITEMMRNESVVDFFSLFMK